MPGWIILHHWETLMPLFTDVVVWLPSANVLVMGDLMTNGDGISKFNRVGEGARG
jgi:hypothetical protein